MIQRLGNLSAATIIVWTGDGPDCSLELSTAYSDSTVPRVLMEDDGHAIQLLGWEMLGDRLSVMSNVKLRLQWRGKPAGALAVRSQEMKLIQQRDSLY